MKTITSAEYHAWLDHPLTKALKQSFEQSVTDTENQPSQYGTVTLEMYEALEDQLAAAQEEVEASSKDSLRLLESVKYLRGIAEHGEERQQREDETVEQFVLGYVKKLEDQLAKANQLWQIAQGRCDGLEEKLAKAEQRVAEACAYLAHQHMDADIAADAINNGEWRKLVKEEM